MYMCFSRDLPGNTVQDDRRAFKCIGVRYFLFGRRRIITAIQPITQTTNSFESISSPGGQDARTEVQFHSRSSPRDQR